MPEILLILAIALIVIGPKKLPELAKTLGRAMGEFKRSAQDFKRSIDMETTLQDINPASTDIKDVSSTSRRDKTDKDNNQEKPGQAKTPPPEGGTGKDSEAEPETDAPGNGGSGDKRS